MGLCQAQHFWKSMGFSISPSTCHCDQSVMTNLNVDVCLWINSLLMNIYTALHIPSSDSTFPSSSYFTTTGTFTVTIIMAGPSLVEPEGGSFSHLGVTMIHLACGSGRGRPWCFAKGTDGCPFGRWCEEHLITELSFITGGTD